MDDNVRARLEAYTAYDDLGRSDPGRGLWGMKCWNAMSVEHQNELVTNGKFRGYHAGTCNGPAETGIETDQDENPGPRFYCRPCGIAYLQSQQEDRRRRVDSKIISP